MCHGDAVAVEHEVELLARRSARIGGQTTCVGAPELCGLHEQVDLVVAPERVEVARDDHRLAGGNDEVVQIVKLTLTMAILERQVHEEHSAVLELELDDQALDAFFEVVEPLTVHAWCGEK